jgi:hypothetical protein
MVYHSRTRKRAPAASAMRTHYSCVTFHVSRTRARAEPAGGEIEDEGLPTEHEETPTARKSANSLIPSLGRVLKDACDGGLCSECV